MTAQLVHAPEGAGTSIILDVLLAKVDPSGLVLGMLGPRRLQDLRDERLPYVAVADTSDGIDRVMYRGRMELVGLASEDTIEVQVGMSTYTHLTPPESLPGQVHQLYRWARVSGHNIPVSCTLAAAGDGMSLDQQEVLLRLVIDGHALGEAAEAASLLCK